MTEQDQSIIKKLDGIFTKHNIHLQSFIIKSNQRYLEKHKYKKIIEQSVTKDIPLCIIDIIVDLVFVPFDILDFLYSISEFHNPKSNENRDDVSCKIIYKDKDECFLNFWREKEYIIFDLKMKETIIKSKMALNEINLYESTFPKKITSRDFCKDAVNLMNQQLLDCWIIKIPEPDWKLQTLIQLFDVIIVGISSHGNYVGFNCGFHGKDVFRNYVV